MWFWDSAFMDVVKASDIDYLVWFTPYKHCDMFSSIGERVELPKAVVMNIKNIQELFRCYKSSNMVSAEL